jgi:hydrogenase maturation protease
MKGEIIVLGFGSDILADENIVPMMIQRLRKEFPCVDFYVSPLLALELLNEVNGYEKIIIIDTVIDTGKPVGTVHFHKKDPFIPTLHLSNYHDISLIDFVATGKFMGYKITNDIDIIAINIADHLTISTSLSPDIHHEYPNVYQEIRQYLVGQKHEYVR